MVSYSIIPAIGEEGGCRADACNSGRNYSPVAENQHQLRRKSIGENNSNCYYDGKEYSAPFIFSGEGYAKQDRKYACPRKCKPVIEGSFI